MKKIMNHPIQYCSEAVEGAVYAHPERMKLVSGNPHLISRAVKPAAAKTSILAVCDGGHFPMYYGYIGDGMLDGCAIGDIYQAPAWEEILSLITACDQGCGTILLFDGTFCAENCARAVCEAEKAGIFVSSFSLCEDWGATFGFTKELTRCGAGLVFCCKLAGAAAAIGWKKEEILALLNRTQDQIATLGLIAESGYHPHTGEQLLMIPADRVQIGGGLHTEKGFEEIPVPSADTVADHMFRKKLNALIKLSAGDSAAVMVNGFGGTPQEDLYIVFRKLAKIMEKLGIRLVHPMIGTFAGNLGTNGLSITIMKLDDELLKLWNTPADTITLTVRN